jgi:hypothetical protein
VSARSTEVRADLRVEQILAWADAHHEAHGAWPAVGPATLSGEVPGAPGESWKAINHALAMGLRGLPGDSSLAELLAEHRGVPLPDMGPRALAEKIWAWEREQFPVKGPRRCLRQRLRGTPLTIEQIIAWAKAHHAATGKWPKYYSGPVRHAPFDVSWCAINSALRLGTRGLPPGWSLRRLLAEHCDAPSRPRLTLEQVLAWADAHHAATGAWPTLESGKVLGCETEGWSRIDNLLRLGQRGLPGGLSVARMLQQYRGVSDRRIGEPITIEQILHWADAHHAATGQWPAGGSGPVSGGPAGLTWRAIDSALVRGARGLPRGWTLCRLLAEERGVRPALSYERILAWADAFHAAGGRWPTALSGAVAGAERETWNTVDYALKKGLQGLPGGESLCRLLAERRGARNKHTMRPLRVEQILAWADAFHVARGGWPHTEAGPVEQAPGETWQAIDSALKIGGRGLDTRISLARLLLEHRGPDAHNRPPGLSVEQVLAWADAFHAANGRWPTKYSGSVPDAPQENWNKITLALRKGHRGLPRLGSLAQLLAQHRNRPNPAAKDR